jgi:WD40 repeat protein
LLIGNAFTLWHNIFSGGLYPFRKLSGHTKEINAVAFRSDCSGLLTGSSDGTARIWDLASGTPKLSIPHPDAVWSAAFAPDGQRLVTGNADGTARIFDSRTGQLLMALPAHSKPIRGVAFSPDGSRVVICSESDATVHDSNTGKRLVSLQNWLQLCWRIQFSPDGNSILSTSSTEGAELWDTNTGILNRKWPRGTTAAAFSPDGKRIVTMERPDVNVWDMSTGSKLDSFGGNWLSFSPYAAISPDWTHVLSYDGDNLIGPSCDHLLRDLKTGKLEVELDGADYYSECGAISSAGYVAAGCGNGNVFVWDATAMPMKSHWRITSWLITFVLLFGCLLWSIHSDWRKLGREPILASSFGVPSNH